MPCTDRFGRLYDLKRHLAAAHELVLEDEEIKQLLDNGLPAEIGA